MQTSNGFVTICVCYWAPGVDPPDLDELCRWACHCHCLVLRDFKAPHVDLPGARCLPGADRFSREVIEYATKLALHQHVHRSMRIFASLDSTLDLVLPPHLSDVKIVGHLSLLDPSDQSEDVVRSPLSEKTGLGGYLWDHVQEAISRNGC